MELTCYSLYHKKNSHSSVRAARANFFAPIVANPKKRRARHSSVLSVTLRTTPLRYALRHYATAATSRCSCVAAACSCFRFAGSVLRFAGSVLRFSPFHYAMARAATPFQARPPKTQDSFSKRIPIPYSGVRYRAPFKYARCARFGVDSCSYARASASALFVYKCIQVFTSVPFA